MADLRGLHDKFVVRRRDGRDTPGAKHDGCEYFVLDLTHDPAAWHALAAYAKAVEQTRPVLSDHLVRRITAYERRGGKTP